MAYKALIKKFIALEIELDIDVSLLDSRVYTILYKDTLQLCIEIQVELENFERLTETPLYARTRLLVILGIISFLIQEAFTPIDANSGSSNTDVLSEVENEKFNFSGENYLHSFKEIVKFITTEENSKVKLFYSLLDRWRKALYLEKESEENMIHDDEVLLSYFHIMELVSTEYYHMQKEEAVAKINEFSKSFLCEINFSTDNQLENELGSKIKLIKEIMLSRLPVKSKILYMLNKQDLLTNRLHSYISQIIDDRNSVAHGRQVFLVPTLHVVIHT